MLISYLLYVAITWWCYVCTNIAPLCMLPVEKLQHSSGDGYHQRGQSLGTYIAAYVATMLMPCPLCGPHVVIMRSLYMPGPVRVLMRICPRLLPHTGRESR